MTGRRHGGIPHTTSRGLDRRSFLQRAAAAAGGLAMGGPLLTACSGPDGSGGGDPSRTVRVSNWPLYVAAGTAAGFTEATGLDVAYTEDVNDNNEFFAKIAEPLARGQSIDRDVVVLTNWMVARLMRLGYCAPLDDAAFPNKARMMPDLLGSSHDPGRRYSAPWLSGMVGIAYDPRLTEREITEVADLFDPAFRGRVTMLMEMRDTLGLVMLGEGRDPATTTRADVEAACATVKRYRENGHVRAFTGNEYAEDLASGNVAIAMAWSGDIASLAADNPELRFVIPRDGGMLFSDEMFVPVTSDRVGAAMAWMDYVYRPEVSARIVEATQYISPVQGAEEELARIAPDVAASPLVNPSPEVRGRLTEFRDLREEEEQDFGRLFLDAIGA